MAGEDLPAPQFQETKSTFGVTLHGHGRYLHTVPAPHHVAATATDGALTARREVPRYSRPAQVSGAAVTVVVATSARRWRAGVAR